MGEEEFELYLELLNGIVGIAIFAITLSVFIVIRKNPNLIKSYFFIRSGDLSRPFLFLMIGMLIWGIRELSKVLELQGILNLGLFYEVTELFSALFLLAGMILFYRITRTKKHKNKS